VFALVVRFDLVDEAGAEQFDALTAEAVHMIKENEEGTLIYATHVVEGAPLSRVFYEVYRDRAAFQYHETAPHVVKFHARKNPFVASHRVEFLSPAHAKGLEGSQ
jgi:quinol monooxygenase YgiN